MLRTGYNFGNFLRNRALARTVILQAEIFDHFVGILARRVHRGAARRLLRSIRLAQCAIENTGENGLSA